MKDFLCRKPYIHDNDILTRLFYTRITKMKEKKKSENGDWSDCLLERLKIEERQLTPKCVSSALYGSVRRFFVSLGCPLAPENGMLLLPFFKKALIRLVLSVFFFIISRDFFLFICIFALPNSICASQCVCFGLVSVLAGSTLSVTDH